MFKQQVMKNEWYFFIVRIMSRSSRENVGPNPLLERNPPDQLPRESEATKQHISINVQDKSAAYSKQPQLVDSSQMRGLPEDKMTPCQREFPQCIDIYNVNK